MGLERVEKAYLVESAYCSEAEGGFAAVAELHEDTHSRSQISSSHLA